MGKINTPLLAAILIVGQSPCFRASGQTHLEMNDRSAAEFARTDRELAVIYEKFLATIRPSEQAGLRRAQAIWTQFRDQECKFESLGSKAGSNHEILLDDCKARLNQTRIDDFNRELNCGEGDTACGDAWVPDETTAIKIAEAVLARTLRETDKPLTANLEGDHWVVRPTLPHIKYDKVVPTDGGFELLIDRMSGRVIRTMFW